MFDGSFKASRKVNLSGRKKPAFGYGATAASSSSSASAASQASSKEELLLQSKFLREERLAHRKRMAASTKIQALYRRVVTMQRVRTHVFSEVETDLTTILGQLDVRSQPLPIAKLQVFLRKFLRAYGANNNNVLPANMTTARVRNVQDYLIFMLLVSALKGTAGGHDNILTAKKDSTFVYQTTRMLEIALQVAVTTPFVSFQEQAAHPYVLFLDTFSSQERYVAGDANDNKTAELLLQRLALSTRFGLYDALQQLITAKRSTQDANDRVAQIVGKLVAQSITMMDMGNTNVPSTVQNQLLRHFAHKIVLAPNSLASSFVNNLSSTQPRSFWADVLAQLGDDGSALSWSERAIAVGNVLDLVSHSSFSRAVVSSGMAVLRRLISQSHVEWAFDVDSDAATTEKKDDVFVAEDIEMDDDDQQQSDGDGLATTISPALLAGTTVDDVERQQAQAGIHALQPWLKSVKTQWQQVYDTTFVRRCVDALQGDHDALRTLCGVYASFLLGVGRSHLLTVHQSFKPPNPALFSFLSAVSTSELVSLDGRGPKNPDAPIVKRVWELVKTTARSDQSNENDAMLQPLLLFNVIYSHMLLALDDETFYDRAWPCQLQEVSEIVAFLKQFIYDVCWNTNSGGRATGTGATTPADTLPRSINKHLFATVTSSVKLFNQLYDRDCRRRFTVEGAWLWPAMPVIKETVDLESMEGDHLFELQALSSLMAPTTSLSSHARASLILTTIPQVFSFQDRVQLVEKLLEDEKQHNHHVRDEFSQAIHVRIQRNEIVEESFDFFEKVCNAKSPSLLKSRIKVTFINEQGLEEAGIDGGGVFKEYIDQLTKNAFSSEYGFFLSTSEHLLYPNPAARVLVETNKEALDRFRFLGRVLGKAMYENILVEPQFAAFFLNKLLNKFNYIDDLYSLDPDLYRHLMQLKHYTGNVEDLALTFSVSEMEFGLMVTRNLVPDGANVAVTNANRIRYIHLLANYKLNVLSSAESAAFLRGFRDLIPAKWIQMFSPAELQMLIGGSANKIDVQDWQRNTAYGGGYHPSQAPIQWFWQIVEHEFSAEDRAALLKFITSVSRQPLLGFKQLAPQLCIHQVRIDDDVRLPSSATCMNLLKLPTYSSKEIMKQKLLYAIRANAGFDLS